MVFPLSAFSFLFHSSGTCPGQTSAPQAFQYHGPHSPGYPLFLVLFLQPFHALSFSVLALLFFLSKSMVFSAFSSPQFVSEYFSYLMVQDPFRSSESPIRHLPLSVRLQRPSLFPEDLHSKDLNPTCSSLLDLSLILAYCDSMVTRQMPVIHNYHWTIINEGGNLQ